MQDPTQLNRDNYDNERRETGHTLRNKKRDYLKGKLSEIETKNKNIRDLYKGIKYFKKGYQERVNVIKMRMRNCSRILTPSTDGKTISVNY